MIRLDKKRRRHGREETGLNMLNISLRVALATHEDQKNIDPLVIFLNSFLFKNSPTNIARSLKKLPLDGPDKSEENAVIDLGAECVL